MVCQSPGQIKPKFLSKLLVEGIKRYKLRGQVPSKLKTMEVRQDSHLTFPTTRKSLTWARAKKRKTDRRWLIRSWRSFWSTNAMNGTKRQWIIKRACSMGKSLIRAKCGASWPWTCYMPGQVKIFWLTTMKIAQTSVKLTSWPWNHKHQYFPELLLWWEKWARERPSLATYKRGRQVMIFSHLPLVLPLETRRVQRPFHLPSPLRRKGARSVEEVALAQW